VTTQAARVLDDELRATAERIVAKYPNKRSAILPLLFLVQSVEGFVSQDGMRQVGEILALTPAEVLAAASFYTMLKKEPTGTYVVSVCRNLSCTHRGARKVIAALSEHLGIDPGETTSNGAITLETAECLATCDGAPSAQVNYEDLYDLTPESAVAIVDRLTEDGEVTSVRGEPIRTHKEISYETAVAGLALPEDETTARTVGGESPAPDMAPGFRPKEPGTDGSDGGG
jgi:NADH:ubiquinone oxidoreductase subunit E